MATSGDKWMVNPHSLVVRCSNDEVVVRSGAQPKFTRVVRDPEENGVLADAVEMLSTGCTVAELVESLSSRPGDITEEFVSGLVQNLEQERLIVKVNGLNPVSSHLAFAFGNDNERELPNKVIGIVGGGGVGVRLANHLMHYAVKKVKHLSNATLESSRVTGTLGFPYNPQADTSVNSARWMEESLSFKNRTGEHERKYQAFEGNETDKGLLRNIFADTDLVVVALDQFSPSILHTVNEVAIELGKQWIFGYVDGGETYVGPLFTPGETACYLELVIQRDAMLPQRGQRSHRGVNWLFNEKLNKSEDIARPSLVPAHIDVVAGIITQEVITFLVSGKCALMSRTLYISLETLEFSHSNVLNLPRCPACSMNNATYRSTFH